MAGLSIVVAVATGIAWLGQPLRMVQLLTIIGLSMTAGVAWGRAVWGVRQAAPAGAVIRLARGVQKARTFPSCGCCRRWMSAID